jgi:hypothetical protein
MLKRKNIFNDLREAREGMENMSIEDDEDEIQIRKRSRI